MTEGSFPSTWKRLRLVSTVRRRASAEVTTAQRTVLAEETAQRLERQLDYGQQPDVEQIQDTVEKVLIDNGHASTAKSYILCRADRRPDSGDGFQPDEDL